MLFACKERNMKRKSVSGLLKELNNAKRKSKVRMHMPGSKGKRLGFIGNVFKYDFTEVSRLDNLYNPKGVIEKSQKSLAENIGAKEVFFLVGGSSCGVLSLLSLFKDSEVLMARDFHISAANAIELFNINPVYIYPGKANKNIDGVVSKEQIKQALEKNKSIKAVYLTYPNYYGYCSDIAGISKITHEKGVPLILDAAHSACFPYSDLLPDSPAKTGADAWVVSTHKTLPAMNQSAYIGIKKEGLIPTEKVKEKINIFQTTSPSYPILASIDFSDNYMIKLGRRRIEKLFSAVELISKKIDAHKEFEVIKTEKSLKKKDFMKLAIDYSRTGFCASEIAEYLEGEGVYAEAVDTKYILLLLSPVDNKRDLNKVYKALEKVKAKRPLKKEFNAYNIPKTIQAKRVEKEIDLKNIKETSSYISAGVVSVYPPGVPVLIKGDLITSEIIEYIEEALDNDLSVVGVFDNKMRVYTKK